MEIGEAGAKRGDHLLQVRWEARTEGLLVIDPAGGDRRVGVVHLAPIEHLLESVEGQLLEIVAAHVRSLW
jgi:hypothetical protein